MLILNPRSELVSLCSGSDKSKHCVAMRTYSYLVVLEPCVDFFNTPHKISFHGLKIVPNKTVYLL